MNMNHRKLISDTVVTINITALCEPYCDNINSNISGYCPDLCFFNCPSLCTTPPPRVTTTTVHYSHKHHYLSLIISLCLIGLACLLYRLFILYIHCKSNRRRQPLQQPQQQQQQTPDHHQFLDEEEDLGPVLDHPIWYIRTVGLQPSVIDLITVCKYKRGDGLVEGTDCAVCLSEFQDDETLRLLPKCNHAFHLPCIDTWLRSHTNCPMCRAPIVSHPGGTLSPVLGQSSEDSATGEENVEAISQGREELEEERESGDFGFKDVESSRHGRGISGSTEKYMAQPMPRSISMDSLAPSRLDSALANGEPGEMSKPNMAIIRKRVDLHQGLIKSVGASSFRKSLQKGPVLMKRSFSCSGKVLFSEA